MSAVRKMEEEIDPKKEGETKGSKRDWDRARLLTHL
jgi:hypothetical protein